MFRIAPSFWICLSEFGPCNTDSENQNKALDKRGCTWIVGHWNKGHDYQDAVTESSPKATVLRYFQQRHLTQWLKSGSVWISMGLWFRDCGFLGCQSITHNVCYNTGLGFSRWHFLEKGCENAFLWIFTAVLEQHNWKQPEEGRIYLSYMSWATVHWEKRRQEYKEGWNLEAAADIEAMRVVLLIGFLQMAWSACFLMAPRTTSLRVAPIMVSELGPSYQPTIKKMHHKLAHRPVEWDYFS